MVGYIQGIKSVDVELTFNPPWDFNTLSDEVKIELGLL
jgi:metal-sulfur cluster biosynthetic enzyme